MVEAMEAETERYYYGTGRRKTASAQVRLYLARDGEANVVVNGKLIEEYFPRLGDVQYILEPLEATGTLGQFRITVMVRGGGISGQAGAIRHGIARALLKADSALRPQLKQRGFLTRDPRAKERKKPGLKRARKAPQYTKR